MLKQQSLLSGVLSWLSIVRRAFVSASGQSTQYKHHHLFFWIPVILGALASGLLVSIAPWGNNTLVAITLVLSVSVALGWSLQLHHKRAIEGLLKSQEKFRSNDVLNHQQIYEAWSAQIDACRNDGDKTVAELTELFAGIVKRISQMLKQTKDNAGFGKVDEKGVLDTISDSQADVQTVFKDLKYALEAVNDSKDVILAEITMFSASMRDMASNAQHVAMQSRIIALNAEIEAARAGEAGRAFAAVVGEMRQLANQSGENSAAMAKRVTSINEAMARFYSDDADMAKVEKEHVKLAEEMLDVVIERFNKTAVEMGKAIKAMEYESINVRDDISKALVALQFQDRVSQIMTHIADNIIALSRLDEEGDRYFDVDRWIEEMISRFSVDLEHESLKGRQNAAVSPGELTFF